MKVRDLRQYISSLTDGKDTPSKIGSDKESFLNVMSGKGQTVSGLITSAASFANNAKEQLFYEFVQNAYDASADSLFFYANKDYLIVLNNGEPFYTDLDIFNKPEGEKPRDGQLYNFLAKGKSLKQDDGDKLGQYGQGSKLLYTLLADVNHKVKTDDLLKEVIITNKKGPYLVSWNDMAQLDAWLINDNNWIAGQADDVENNILFAKIVMSYYPIAPGQAPELFSNEEAQHAIQAFNELVDPPRNKSFLTRGTALIIPLGDGKYEAITDSQNLENVRDRLGGFASITADQDWNKGKQLKHIYVMGTEVEQLPARSLLVKFEEEGNEFEYHFAFNRSFSEKNVVNFFKGLPILQARHRFGFILDSQAFDVDDSRQRITDVEKTCEQLKMAFTHLVEELKVLKEKNREKFDFIYRSLVASRPDGNTPEEQKIRDVYYEIMRPFFEEYVLTSENEYVEADNVKTKEKDVDILLSKLGYEDLHWIHPDIQKDYNNSKLPRISQMGFAEMLNGADEDKLEEWVMGMFYKEYVSFHKKCLECLSLIEETPVFKSNKKKLYSWKALRSNINVYYMCRQYGNIFPGQEYIIESMKDEYENSDYQSLYNKVKANCEELRASTLGRDAACRILALDRSTYKYGIKTDFPILQNGKGEFLPFAELFLERPEGTILFDDFCVKGVIPEVLKDKNWFVDTQPENSKRWDWVVEHFEDLKAVDGWNENAQKYIEDIKTVFDSCTLSAGYQTLSLYLDEEGVPTDVPCKSIDNFSSFTQEEYEMLQQVYPEISFVPYKYEALLNSKPFALTKLRASDLLDPSKKLSFEGLKLFCKVASTLFPLNYYVEEYGDNYFVKTLRTSEKNYVEDLGAGLKQILSEIGFHYIPERVQSLINCDKAMYKITGEDNTKAVIDKVADKISIFPLVSKSTIGALYHYLRNLNAISIDSPIKKNDFRWELIKTAVSRSNDDLNLKDVVFRLIRHEYHSLPNTIKDTIVRTDKYEYNLYDLNEEYKDENELIDSFLNCLPSSDDADWFKDMFYAGNKKEVVSLDDIYESIEKYALSITQLCFCLDYLSNHESDDNQLSLENQNDLPKALTEVKKRNFKRVDRYWDIEDFYPSTQVFAAGSLLTEDEILPTLLQKWLEQNPDGSSIFCNLITDKNDFIALRKSIKNNEPVNQIPEFDDSNLAKNTITWLLESVFRYTYGSNAFKAISKVIEALPTDYPNMAFLRYTGEVEVKEGKGKRQTICPVFVLSKYVSGGSLYSSHSWKPIFLDMLKDNQRVKYFFQREYVYLYNEHELLIKHKLHNCPKLDVSMKATSTGDYQEFDSDVYRKWKQMEESRNIIIKTSTKSIGINFTILKGKEQAFAIQLDDKEYGYDENHFVVVKYPNSDGLSPIKKIEKHIADMDFFQKPFIVLQGLYVEQMEKLERMAEEKGTNIEQIVESENGGGDGNLKVEEDKLDSVKELANDLDVETLKRLAEEKDRLMEMLEDMKEADEEEPESKVRQIIGYIGERIYEQYLLSQNVEFQYAAIEGTGEYDFFNKTDNKYVDVKTSLYSLKDGTAPFYLHRSQNVFMQKHPEAEYRIVRISLKDLNLQKGYERIRDIYGKDADPMADPRLDKECQQLAKKYWLGSKIEEFDANSPEYAIHIEKRVSHE